MAEVEKVPREAVDWDEAPGVIEGSMNIELRPDQCGVEVWLREVAQGPLKGLVRGRRPDSTVPDFLREPGPLRESLMREFAFRAETETAATKACALVVAAARTIPEMEFYTTQTVDEARHSLAFREHLLDLGVPPEELMETADRAGGEDARRIVDPLWEWGLPRFGGEFVNGVVIITILLEGVLAPASELSEHKWSPISEATADIERGACVDEIRHLTVGSWIIRNHLIEHPDEKQGLLDLISEGRELWQSLPVPEIIYNREVLFQEGIDARRDDIGDAELTDGVRLVDTTPEDRLKLAVEWSQEVQEKRLEYMGLEEAIPEPVQSS